MFGIIARQRQTSIVDRAPFRGRSRPVSTISSERGRAVKLAVADAKLTFRHNPDSARRPRNSMSIMTSPIDIVASTARHYRAADGDTVLFACRPGSPILVQDRDGAAAFMC
jgi:DNA polymerase-3 subunit beta